MEGGSTIRGTPGRQADRFIVGHFIAFRLLKFSSTLRVCLVHLQDTLISIRYFCTV